MAISKDTVKYVAHLARLSLKPREQEKLSRQLEEILKYMEKLNQVDVSHIAPTSHILPIKNIYRKDELRPSLGIEAVLNNTAEKKGSSFSVPKVIT